MSGTAAPTSASFADRARDVVARLSREDKLRAVSGADFWHTSALADHGVPSIMLTDGPHGLRKQQGSGDHVGLSDAAPATCFPTAVDAGVLDGTSSSSRRSAGPWAGRRRAADVGVLLGPGLNLKRHPAGGRSFEYFSEDPLLSGSAAVALVRGIQAEGVGACAKHFAVNNQEGFRMRLDTVVDERTLRELYLPAFEAVVREDVALGGHVGVQPGQRRTRRGVAVAAHRRAARGVGVLRPGGQ